ncbi:unnamed protein product [Diamesa serratosioi]
MAAKWFCLLVITIGVCHAEQIAHDGYFETFYVAPDPFLNEQSSEFRNAISLDEYKWPDGVIPYSFDEKVYSEKDKVIISEAMEIFSENTCIKFVKTNEEESSVHQIKFVKSKLGCGTTVGCHSYKNESQLVAYTNDCISKRAAIQHELLHVIGLFHEQCRNDRDEYIDIHWENIEESRKYNFNKVPEKYVNTFNLPYDFKSLMHYPRHAFSKDGKSYTMTLKNDTTIELGQTDLKKGGPTYLDLEKVRRMYNC